MPSQGSSRPMAVAKANPAAACPDGNDAEPGIRTFRPSGTPTSARSGRRRDQADFAARFTSGDVTAMATVPRTAARRPAGPPRLPSPAAITKQRTELLAASESRRTGASSEGVGVVATAAKTARSTASSSRSPAAARSRTGPPRRASSSASRRESVPAAPAAGSRELSGSGTGVSGSGTGAPVSATGVSGSAAGVSGTPVAWSGSPGMRVLPGNSLIAVQRVLEFLFGLLGQGGLQDRAAVLAHRLDGLVGGHLLQHQEQRRVARLDYAADLFLELLVDAALGELAHERAHTGPYRHPEYRDEEEQAEQEPPEHAPGRSAADQVVTGVDVIAAIFIPHDHRDRVRLDDQVLGQPPGLVGGSVRGRHVRVSDGDQVSHGISFLSWFSCLLVRAGCLRQPSRPRPPRWRCRERAECARRPPSPAEHR